MSRHAVFNEKLLDVDRQATFAVPRKAPEPAHFDVKQLQALGDENVGKDVKYYLANLRTFREGGVTLAQHVLGSLRDREGLSYLSETEATQTLRAALEQGETALAHKFGSLNMAKMGVERPEQLSALQSAPGEPTGRQLGASSSSRRYDSFTEIGL